MNLRDSIIFRIIMLFIILEVGVKLWMKFLCILKINGIYKLHNISIHDMPNWWIYQYFPAAYYVDRKRFWKKDVIFSELSIRGFKVNIEIKYRM